MPAASGARVDETEIPASRVETANPSGQLAMMITGRNPMGGGGLETYVRAHALAAVAAGFDVHVFCLGRRTVSTTTDFGVVHQIGVTIRFIRMPLAVLYGRAFAAAVCAETQRVGSDQPVIVHAFGSWAAAGPAVSGRLSRLGTANVLVASAFTTVEHEQRAKVDGLRRTAGLANRARYWGLYGVTRLFGARSETRGFLAARVLLVNYDSVRDILIGEFTEHPDVRKVPYTSDLAFRPAREKAPTPEAIGRLRPADAALVVCLSRHDPRKGIEVLVRSLATLTAAGVPYRACLVGRGELIKQHRRLVRRLGLDDHIAITGLVPDILPYLQAGDVYALPSLEEGSGSLALLEALQLGLAVVASDCDGISEDVRDQHDALLVTPGDERALTDALRRLLTDADLRDELGSRARTTYAARFSRVAFVEALASVYRELSETA
jgi:glycosyltransferase involved in cell wall biosynthesis